MSSPYITPRRIARVAVLAALSAVLYFIPGIPIFPPIYKLDFSTVPVMVGALIGGPIDALIVLLIKDLTGLLHSSSMGVGELADFLTSAALVVSLWGICAALARKDGAQASAHSIFILQHESLDIWKLICAFILSVIAMAAVGAIVNYYIMIPFYVNVMHLSDDTIIAMMAKLVPSITSIGKLIAYATVPFNLIKGAIICVITYPLYKAVSPIIKKFE
ncbi:MAG: ECF transporter S component [Clostridiales bacterium]|nr:ECF transporter S component [Clostridiales bacterium]